MYEYYHIRYIPKCDWYTSASEASPLLRTVKSAKISNSWKNNDDISTEVENIQQEGGIITDIYRYDFLSRKKFSVFE